MQDNVNGDYVIHIFDKMAAIEARVWDSLLAQQSVPSPFMSHAYLSALTTSGSAAADTGWTLRLLSLWQGNTLAAACPIWIKTHSRGEYVFDWAWAQAYAHHGLAYYPKAVVASPFTPVPGSRLLAKNQSDRQALVQALVRWCKTQTLSSLHILFAGETDLRTCEQSGLMRRNQIQFHWENKGWASFDDFLGSLNQDKRKKIRQERRKVHEAGVVFRVVPGQEASESDWAFAAHCYQQTYWEHGNPPYLTPDFFLAMRRDMPQNWLLFIGERAGRPMAMSLMGLQQAPNGAINVAYGRYWGATQRVDCLHFEACYYQPIAWCIAHGVQRFEGGAQGEHKMARALLPTPTASAHWVAHPAFAQAIENFLAHEQKGLDTCLLDLQRRNPLRQPQA